MLLALLFITISYLQVSSIALAGNSPPTTPSVPAGETSGLSGTYSSYITKASDPDGNQLKYTFDWGDGTASTTCLVNQGVTVKVFHKWAVSSGATKTFNVKARAADMYGSASGWSNPLSVAVINSITQDQVYVNNAPATPSIPSGSTSGSSGTSYRYYTKGSDPDGDSVMYKFDWGDGVTSTTSLVASGASASASHAWTVASGETDTFSVRAMSIDKSGMASGWSSPVSVTINGPVIINNPPGTPSIPSGPTSGSSGTSYSYSTRATDPEGNRVKYTFDWGDGTTSATSLVASGTTASAYHSWTVASGTTKTFSVKATATDEGGKVSGSSNAISVTIKGPDIVASATDNNPPRTPRIPEGNLVGRTTYSYTYKTLANDPDGDMVKYTFDWGDGFMSTTDYVPSGTYASASHKWSGVTPGTFKGFYIKAMATDINGGKSAWSSPLPVSMGAPYVNHRPTIPVVSGPTQCKSGTPCKFTIIADDPDEKDTLKYLIHWGDYSTETAYFPAGQPVTVYHTWNVPAGKTWICKIIAVAVDPYQLGSLDWSEPFVVTVTGPSLSSTIAPLIFADELGPEADENETIYAQSEEPEFIEAQIEENQSEVDQTGETEPVDSQIEEDQSMVEQIEENLIVDELATEDYNIAVDDTYYIASNDSVLKINAPGVLENDQQGSDKSLSVSSYSQPAYAADFSMNSDGSFTYTASQDYCGEDSFTYKTTDGDLESNEATVAILIDCSLHNDEEVLY